MLPYLSQAKKYTTSRSFIKAEGKVAKHFDRNEDGYLSRYEWELYKTHKYFGYPLAKKKKQKPYDTNQNLMLEPFEYKRYLADKKAGKLKKYDKEDEKKNIVFRQYRGAHPGKGTYKDFKEKAKNYVPRP
jgi:hypothetical protein